MPRPVGALLGEASVLGLLVEGTPQHVEELGDERCVSRFGAIDGELSDVVSEHVFGIAAFMARLSLAVGRAVFSHARDVALEPNA